MVRAAGVNGLDRTEVSCGGDNPQAPLAVGGKRQTGPDVLGGQIREVTEDFLDRHSRGKIVKHIPDGDAQPADAGLAAPLVRLNCNKLRVIHSLTLISVDRMVKRAPVSR